MDTFWESTKKREGMVRRKRLGVVVGLLMLGLIVTVTPIGAEHQESVSICEVDDAGALPGSPFYFVKDWERTMRLWLASNKWEKAELSLAYAGQDALAVHALCDREEYILGGKQCGEFWRQFQRTLAWTEAAKHEGRDIAELLVKVKHDHLCQQQVLAATLENVPEWAREGVLIAIENSSSALENFIEAVQGEQEMERFREKLNMQFGNVNEETQVWIQERLGTATKETTEHVAGTTSIPAPKVLTSVNQQPHISTLTADVDWLAPEASCRIECRAEDADGDGLTYEWSAKKGDIRGTGAFITWTAPKKEGSYDVAVAVSDGQGSEVVESLTIDVILPDAPAIDDLILTPRHPRYFIEQSSGECVILKERSCEIECVVENDEGLSYDWQAEAGDISGTGPVVVWTAPSSKGRVTVTVTVCDGWGQSDTESVVFRVSTCAQCFV